MYLCQRDIRKPALPPANLSPVLSGYVVDDGLPNPCRHFCGRDAELDALHSLPEEAFECMERFRYDSGMKCALKEMGRLLKDESVATPYHRTLLKAFQAKVEGKSKKPSN